MTLLKDIIQQFKKRNKMDDFEIGEFNKICNFGFKLLILLLISLAAIYTTNPNFVNHYNATLGISGLIAVVCYINVIRMTRKGLLVLNHNMDLLLPAFAFLPPFIIRTVEIILYYPWRIQFNIDIWNVVWIIILIIMYLFINRLYIKVKKRLDEECEEFEKDL